MDDMNRKYSSLNASLAARVDSNKDNAELREQLKQRDRDADARMHINIELRKTNSALSEENEGLKAELGAVDRLSAARHKVADELNTELGQRSRELAAMTVERDRLRQDARAADTKVKCEKMNAMADKIASLERMLDDDRQAFRAIGPTCQQLTDMVSRFINRPFERPR